MKFFPLSLERWMNPRGATSPALPLWFLAAAAVVLLAVVGLATSMAAGRIGGPPPHGVAPSGLGGEQLALDTTNTGGTNASNPPASAAASCDQCGVVTSVVTRHVRGKATGLGAVAGGVLGGVVGHQFGRGTGNTLLTAGGVVAGGLEGAQIEKNLKAYTAYDVHVRLNNGQTHVYRLKQPMAVGTQIKVVNGVLHRA